MVAAHEHAFIVEREQRAEWIEHGQRLQEALKGVVAVLMRHVRSSDVVGRLGGDEFGLLLWNLTEADARTKAKALEDAIDQLTFVFKGKAVTAGASAGIALLGPMNDAATALEQADRAMYQRKELRRGMLTKKVRQ